MLKDGQGLLSFLLVPPYANALHSRNATQGQDLARRFGPVELQSSL